MKRYVKHIKNIVETELQTEKVLIKNHVMNEIGTEQVILHVLILVQVYEHLNVDHEMEQLHTFQKNRQVLGFQTVHD